MKRFFFLLSILSICAVTTNAGISSLPWVELTVRPSTATKTDMQISLLPTEDELTDSNAVSLYQKAIKSLPDESELTKFNEWRDTLPDQLPVEEVEAELQKLKPSLDILTQATRCKQCNWPKIRPELVQQQIMDDIKKYQQLANILDTQAKLQITHGQYDQAIETLKTGLTMAKHLGGAPSLIQGLVGVAIARLNLNRIEQLIQSDNSPNLHWALGNLPQPLADVNVGIKFEIDNLQNYNFLIRSQQRKILEPAHERVKQQMNHLDRRIATLQCIEALRLYAGSHEGRPPDILSDVTDFEIPNDPVTEKPFEYKSIGTEAILTIEGTENSEGRDAVQYEIIIKEQ